MKCYNTSEGDFEPPEQPFELAFGNSSKQMGASRNVVSEYLARYIEEYYSTRSTLIINPRDRDIKVLLFVWRGIATLRYGGLRLFCKVLL